MTEINQVQQIITSIREHYCLDKYKANKAFIIAPFGQEYFRKGINNLKTSRAIRSFAKQKDCLVIVVTSQNIDISNCPENFIVIQISTPLGWPSNNSHLNRLIKWGAPLLFKNIKMSIYVDSHLTITNRIGKINRLFKIIKKHKFVNTDHEERDGWEDEYNAIIGAKRSLNLQKVKEQKNFLDALNIPNDIPVCINGFLGCVHNDDFKLLNLEGLAQIFSFSERDQLSLCCV